VGIVINRYHKKSLISLKDAEASLDKKFFGLIDNDYLTTMSAINQGKLWNPSLREPKSLKI